MINGNIITNDAGEKFIFALVSGHSEPLTAHQSHPNFKSIAAKFLAGEENGFADLFDVPSAIEREFKRLSERVTAKNGRLYFDGDEVHGTLVDTILAFMDEGEDFEPLIKFFENVAANPNDHSREQLYDWLVAQQQHDEHVTIDSDGMLVAYKGVNKNSDDSLRSGWAGKAIVNGVEVVGYIPNEVGSIIEMPRSAVVHDPGSACSTGLHVGTFNYAKAYARGAMLRVSVNPRDVVSVPTDAGGQKVRVCRYVVEEIITQPVSGVLLPVPEAETLDSDLDLDTEAFELREGDRVQDSDGDAGTVVKIEADNVTIEYDEPEYGLATYGSGEATLLAVLDSNDEPTDEPTRGSDGRVHGKGGPTSYRAKGRGRNPAQDTLGRFSAGRPGAQRDKTGRFCG